MEKLKEHEKADKIYKQACDLLPKNDLVFKSKESPMVLFERIEILVRTAKVLYSRGIEIEQSCREGINKCDKLLEDLGRYYGWLSAYYLEKAKGSADSEEITVKKYLKKSEKCKAHYKRLCNIEVNEDKINSR